MQLPADDGAHDAPLEWWYWTGHLRSAADRWFGFELVFFEMRLIGLTLQVTHHAIADIEAGRFHYRIEWGRRKSRPGPGIDLSHAGLRARGGDGRDRLEAEVDGYRLELELSSRKAPVLHHDHGYLEYDFGGHTYYYSRTRMDARGSLRVGGERLPVTGSAWFDHQWGEMGEVFEQGWDWFGVQLDDDREIMVFRMRFGDQERLRGGTLVPAAGPVIRLRPEEIEITPQGTWTSPHTGCAYPRRWRLRVLDLDLLLTPVLEDQELGSSIPRYWEGAAVVSGSAAGRAFIEINGTCR